MRREQIPLSLREPIVYLVCYIIACHPIERFLNIKQAIKIVLFNETTTRFFTDMSKEVNGANKFIYLVEENYKVHQVALHYKFDRIHQALLSGSSLLDVSTYIKTYMKKEDPFFKLNNGMSKFIKNSDVHIKYLHIFMAAK